MTSNLSVHLIVCSQEQDGFCEFFFIAALWYVLMSFSAENRGLTLTCVGESTATNSANSFTISGYCFMAS